MEPNYERAAKRLVIATLGMLLAAPIVAQATDSKAYTATGCQDWDRSDPKISYGIGGQATNASNKTAYTICPIVRDTMGKSWEKIVIRVDDRDPDANIYCHFKALDNNGNARYTKSMHSNGTGLQSLITVKNQCSGNCIGEPGGMPYSFYCSIPKKSGYTGSSIIGYTLHEGS